MRTALITGVGRLRGIGAGIAREPAGAGWASSCRGGSVVALTSEHTVGNLPYGATKAALDRTVLAAAHELGERGLRANVVNPSPVDTGWMTPAVRAACLAQQPTGRLGTPEDVARVVRFLLSDDGRWITGQLLHANGGFPTGRLPA